MKLHPLSLVFALVSSLAFHAPAAIRCVDVNSAAPAPPYTNWATAAATIQDAVDMADPGDQILVTNGIYQTGGRAVYGMMTNRVAVDKPLVVQSLNGPAVTRIQGYQVPGVTNGEGAVRCVYLTNGAVLVGFTLTKGATQTNVVDSTSDEFTLLNGGGGLWAESRSGDHRTSAMAINCVIIDNAGIWGAGVYGGALWYCTISSNLATGIGGGAINSDLLQCLLQGNQATSGAGASQCMLDSCTVSFNHAGYVGGACYDCTLWNCLIGDNSSSYFGGGVRWGSVTNCVLLGNSAHTGGGAEGATLVGCLVLSNTASSTGGGAAGGLLFDCEIRGNSSVGGKGGGVVRGLLERCTLTGNSAWDQGGGAADARLSNCILTGNSAHRAAGASGCALSNCVVVANSADEAAGGIEEGSAFNSIVYYNTAPDTPNLGGGNIFINCCTYPSFEGRGFGMITNEPLFVDLAGGNFRLQSNSPCINAGHNNYLPREDDLDGNPRVVGGTIDIGAYEYQAPTTLLSYAWAQEYGLPTDGSADFANPDGDGLNNWQEWRAQTDPTNAASVLRMLSISSDVAGPTVTWQSVHGVTYILERSSLSPGAPFSAIQSNLVGQAEATSYTDTNTAGAWFFFYRVGAQ